MHPDLTWTDFKMFNRNKFWCSGISCFVLLKKRDDVCWWRRGKNSNIVITIHNFLQMWIMFNNIHNIHNFVQFCTSGGMAQGTDWCPLAIFLGQLYLHLLLPSAAECCVWRGTGLVCTHMWILFWF